MCTFGKIIHLALARRSGLWERRPSKIYVAQNFVLFPTVASKVSKTSCWFRRYGLLKLTPCILRPAHYFIDTSMSEVVTKKSLTISSFLNPQSEASVGVGHSSHVTCVRFLHDDSSLITVGGNDSSIMQWKLVPKSSSWSTGDFISVTCVQSIDDTLFIYSAI